MSHFSIATYNINSLRLRLPSLLDWADAKQVDVICLQETKVQDKDFPLEALEQAGFYVAYKGETGKNGVAILSRRKPDHIRLGPDCWGLPEEARLLAIQIGSLHIVNTYIPQGREVGTDYFQYKLDWIAAMKDYFSRYYQPHDALLWVGDFNVAPTELDVHAPKRLAGHVGFHPAEQQALEQVKAWGFEDIFRKHMGETRQYTFWDYRVKNALDRGLGWRIDHIYATAPVAKGSCSIEVGTELRNQERPSDHAPVLAQFDLSNDIWS